MGASDGSLVVKVHGLFRAAVLLVTSSRIVLRKQEFTKVRFFATYIMDGVVLNCIDQSWSTLLKILMSVVFSPFEERNRRKEKSKF
jgi:hypothetical protein